MNLSSKIVAGIMAVGIGTASFAGGAMVANNDTEKQYTAVLDEKQTEIDSMSSSMDSLSKRLEEKETEITVLKAEKTTLETDKASLQASVDEKSSEIATLNATLEETNTAHAQEVARINAEIETLQSSNSELESDNEEKQTRMAELQTELETLNSTHAEQVNNLNSQISTLQTEKNLLETQVSDKDTQISTLNTTITEKELAFDSLQTQYDNLLVDFNNLQAQYNQLESESSANEEEVNDLTGQIAVLNARIAELQKQLLARDFVDLSEVNISRVSYSKTLSNGDILFSSLYTPPGLFYYKHATGTVKQVYTSGYYFNKFVEVDGGCLLAKTGGTIGVLYFDFSTEEVSVICPGDGYVRSLHKVNDTYCIFGGDKFTIYNCVTKEMTDITVSGRPRVIVNVEGGCLYSSETSSYEGLYYFDLATFEITPIYSEGYSWYCAQEVEGGCLITSSNSAVTGLYFFDYSTKDFTPVYSDSYNWKCIYQYDGLYLFGGYGTGVLLYDDESKEISPIYTDGNRWEYSGNVEGGCLIGNVNLSMGILYFDNDTKQITKFKNSYVWTDFQNVEGGCLISSSNLNTTGILYFDNDTKEITETDAIFGRDYTFTIDGTEVICDCDDYTYIFDTTTKKMTLKYDKSLSYLA